MYSTPTRLRLLARHAHPANSTRVAKAPIADLEAPSSSCAREQVLARCRCASGRRWRAGSCRGPRPDRSCRPMVIVPPIDVARRRSSSTWPPFLAERRQEVGSTVGDEVERGRRDHLEEPQVGQEQRRVGAIHLEPAARPEPLIGGRADAEVLALLEDLEVTPHVAGAPRVVAGQLPDVLPVARVGIHRDHRVVRRAAAEARAGGKRVPDLAVLRLGVLLGLRVVGVVTNPVVPLHRRVFARLRVPRRHLVVQVAPRIGIGARLEQHDAKARPRQVRRQRPAAGPRADDHEVVVVGLVRLGIVPGLTQRAATRRRRHRTEELKECTPTRMPHGRWGSIVALPHPKQREAGRMPVLVTRRRRQ